MSEISIDERSVPLNDKAATRAASIGFGQNQARNVVGGANR